jgi:hypothetical protein
VHPSDRSYFFDTKKKQMSKKSHSCKAGDKRDLTFWLILLAVIVVLAVIAFFVLLGVGAFLWNYISNSQIQIDTFIPLPTLGSTPSKINILSTTSSFASKRVATAATGQQAYGGFLGKVMGLFSWKTLWYIIAYIMDLFRYNFGSMLMVLAGVVPLILFGLFKMFVFARRLLWVCLPYFASGCHMAGNLTDGLMQWRNSSSGSASVTINAKTSMSSSSPAASTCNGGHCATTLSHDEKPVYYIRPNNFVQ